MALIAPGGAHGLCLLAGLPQCIRFKNSLNFYCLGSGSVDLGRAWDSFHGDSQGSVKDRNHFSSFLIAGHVVVATKTLH